MTPLDSFDFDRAGRRFVAEIVHDDTQDLPWEREEGHGPVSDWTSRPKRAGEREIHRDGCDRRYYDWAGAIAIAKRDGWGLAPAEVERLAVALGRQPTRGEIRAEAVRQDFERLRAWCNDDWCYIGVVVRPADACRCCGPSASLGGIESDAGEYIREVAAELAQEIAP